jgi:phage baseplate assembly protein W
MSNPTTPQFSYPFSIDSTGTAESNPNYGLPVVVEQNSPEDVAACVANIVVCPQGSKMGDPSFGVPSVLFQTLPVNTNGILAAIQKLEPRATTVNVAAAADLLGDVDISVEVGTEGAPS